MNDNSENERIIEIESVAALGDKSETNETPMTVAQILMNAK